MFYNLKSKRYGSALILVLIVLVQGSGLLFCRGFGPAHLVWAATNQSLVTANGRSGPMLLVQGQSLDLKVALREQGEVKGQDQTGWVAAHTPWGWFSYVHGPGWLEGLEPLDSSGFRAAGAGLALPGLILPPGEYVFYAALTDVRDGRHDITSLSTLQVTVLPGLETRDARQLGDKVPVILVHGNMSEKEPAYRWGRFIELAESDPLFHQRHKIYLFRWSSSSSNTDNGAALGDALGFQEELQARKVILVAHSRGGLIARSFMNRYRFTLQGGGFMGQPGGERVLGLITLGTPHKGSPGADLVWTAFSFDLNYSPFLAQFLTQWYVDVLYRPDNAFMLWDDSQGLLTTDPICWHPALLGEQFCSPLQSLTSPLSALNAQEGFFSKIVAFGGSARSDGLFSLLGGVFSGDPPMGNSDLHAALSLASRLMSDFPVISQGFPGLSVDTSFRPFELNDGLVPLTSSLFLDVGEVDFSRDQAGRLTFDQGQLNQACKLKECIPIKDRFTDHLDYLDDDQLLIRVMEKVKVLP